QRFKLLKEGQNFHNLSKDMKNTYTTPERTQNTIYLRVVYDEPAGTVVNVRKSMWIHPKKDRAISIREAARLQSFPDSFIFKGSKDSQYQQIGNAVPPKISQVLAIKIEQVLSR
ncbi:TPA: DNA cytosine methyltransferase, partial [Listeria innocua]|nr:DNA cytosine methyltransferase [Listeria innocua]